MLEWIRQDSIQAVLYIVAIPSTVIMILQTILLLFGVGHEDSGLDSDTSGIGEADMSAGDSGGLYGEDTDVDHAEGASGLRLFTVRGMVAFFAVGGWSGIAALELGASKFVSVIAALLMGVAALLIVASFFKVVTKLQYDGTMSIKNAIGKTGEVYLTIPAKASGSGKINVMIQERLAEIEAVTYGERAIKFGEIVIVTGLIGEGTLIVEPLDKKTGK